MAQERLGQFNIDELLKSIGIASRASLNKGLSGIRDIVEADTAKRLDKMQEKAKKERKRTPWWQRALVSMIPGVGPYAALLMAIDEANKQKKFREKQIKEVKKLTDSTSGGAAGTFMEAPQSSILGQASSDVTDFLQNAMDAERKLGFVDIGLSALPVAGNLTKFIPGAEDLVKAGVQSVSKVPLIGKTPNLAKSLTTQFKTPAISGTFKSPTGMFSLKPAITSGASYSLPSIALPSLWQSAGQAAIPKLSDMLIGEMREPQFVGTRAPKLSRRRRGQVY
jgi:hypothetical protein